MKNVFFFLNVSFPPNLSSSYTQIYQLRVPDEDKTTRAGVGGGAEDSHIIVKGWACAPET